LLWNSFLVLVRGQLIPKFCPSILDTSPFWILKENKAELRIS